MYSSLQYFSPPNFSLPPGFPTADGHLHAIGATNNKNRLDKAKKHKINLSLPPKVRGFDRLASDGRPSWADHGFGASHEAYNQSSRLLLEPSDLYDVLYAHLVREGRSGCKYKRLLTSAMYNVPKDGSAIDTYDMNMQALIKAINDAKVATGIEAFIWASGKRHLEDPVRQAHRLLEAADAFLKEHSQNVDVVSRLVGFEMAGDEDSEKGTNNLSAFYDVFEHASLSRDRGGVGIATGCHASEYLGPSDAAAALCLPGIRCIDQALRLNEDANVVQKVIGKNILVCQLPVSNGMLHRDRLDPNGGLISPNHPMATLHQAGVMLALGTDDPGFQEIRGKRTDLGTTIADEYSAAAALGFGPTALLGFTANAIRFGVMPTEVRNDRLRIINNYVNNRGREFGISLRPEALYVPVNGVLRPAPI